MIAHDLSKILGGRRRRIKAGGTLNPRTNRLRLVGIPRAHLTSGPLEPARPNPSEDIGIHFPAAGSCRREMMSDGSVCGFHAAQVGGDVGSYDKAGELSREEI